jgi:hypothetical protein
VTQSAVMKDRTTKDVTCDDQPRSTHGIIASTSKTDFVRGFSILFAATQILDALTTAEKLISKLSVEFRQHPNSLNLADGRSIHVSRCILFTDDRSPSGCYLQPSTTVLFLVLRCRGMVPACGTLC